MNANAILAELEDLGVHKESAHSMASALQSEGDQYSSGNPGSSLSMIEMKTRKRLIENYKHVISALDGLRSVLEEAKQTLEHEVVLEETNDDSGQDAPGTKEADHEEVHQESVG